jgi:hypothetical protein
MPSNLPASLTRFLLCRTYVLWELREARGDWSRFWLGERATHVAVVEAPQPDSPQETAAPRRGRSRKRSE